MANMAKKQPDGSYQIGIYNVRQEATRKGRATAGARVNGKWIATTRDPSFRRVYDTLYDAHLELTGEPIRFGGM